MAATRDALLSTRLRRVVAAAAFVAGVPVLLGVPWAAAARDERASGTASIPRSAATAWARHAPSVTLIGDSLADSLASGVARESARRGIAFSARTVSGCGIVRGVPADADLRALAWTSACGDVVPGMLAEVGAGAPSLVLWLSSWETANRLIDGVPMRFGTAHGDRRLVRLVDDAVQGLTAGGSRVAFLTVPHRTTRAGLVAEFLGGPYEVAPESTAERRAVDHLNRLLRRYAAAHPRRVTVVDLDAMVCGGRRLCPFRTRGVALRPDDGRHFAGAGPDWVARRLLRRLIAHTPRA